MKISAVAVAFCLARGAHSFSSLRHRPYVLRTDSSLCIKPALHRDRVKLHSIFSEQFDEEEPSEYDLILVGSGNGAMGFLAKYLETAPATAKILILEQGKHFFFTSDITHQNSWTKSYSEGNIFQLHNARTVDNRPIICGRACTVGGGGSINYTMIHESSKWLAKNIGFDSSYWDDLKEELNVRFDRPNPASIETPVTSLILDTGVQEAGFLAPNPAVMKANIPSYKDQNADQLYQFPTQFNTHGQRTNSGVSLINFDDERIRLKTQTEVESLEFTTGRCTKVTTSNGSFVPSDSGRVVLCAGSYSPRLLLPHRDTLQNQAIGMSVNDHIAMPLGLFVPSDGLKVSPKDIYGPVFATTVWSNPGDGDDIVVSMDFFTGSLQKQLYMVSHLFLAFLPNFIKNPMLKNPVLFAITKNVVRWHISVLDFIIGLKLGKPEFITAIIKYNGAQMGQYEMTEDKKITLRWFEGDQDKTVAKDVIANTALPFLRKLGTVNGLVAFLYNTFTKIPFYGRQVDSYVENYAKNSLLSEQHLAGGCLFGDVLETGEATASNTGLVRGTNNLHVADLSAVPLPRVSPQMTAYIVGYHVANLLTRS